MKIAKILQKIYVVYVFKISYKCNDHVGPPRPLPKESYVDKWDDHHVKMPFSDSNVDRKGDVHLISIKVLKN